jgi:serine protease AprX
MPQDVRRTAVPGPTTRARRQRTIHRLLGAVGVTAMTLTAAAGAAGAAGAATRPAAGPAGSGVVSASGKVVVRALPGKLADAERLVVRLGGTITRRLPIIDGLAATLPAGAQRQLASSAAVLSVTADVSGHVMAVDPALGYDAAGDTGGLYGLAKVIGANTAWRDGWTGKGVDVAVIDTGVAPVKGLTSGNVVNGPDLSFDSQDPNLRYKDAYGHGTHMASIIAGRDAVGTPAGYDDPKVFAGIAPDARVISLKVGASDGSADVSQVIAAIDWVAKHAHDSGLNIRVLNLSFGTDSTQDYHVDPLAYAAQVAWRKGVLVVVAGGNDGTSHVQLSNPAQDGNLLAVGAEDPRGTTSPLDDTIPDFSNRGTATRHVDIVAPGVHVLGLRVPNGVVDQAYPSARVGTRFFRGSGTSQSTAVVSGAAALLFQRYPSLSPQQAKMILGYGATWFAGGTTLNSGAGVLNVPQAMSIASSSLLQSLLSTTTATFGDGSGLLELARGTGHVALGGVALTGEKDIFGKAWGGKTWAQADLAGTSWTASGSWNGTSMTGATWATPTDWASVTWKGTTWTGAKWTSLSWSGRRWVTSGWDGGVWEGKRWVSNDWESRRWVNSTWS